jgi:signal transduction histidine kinase
VTFLSADRPAVAIELLGTVQLSDSTWLAILPDIGPVGRNRLRDRQDLSPRITRALASFGTTDFALPSATPNTQPVADDLGAVGTGDGPGDDSVDRSPSEIADLVRRIEAYRERRSDTTSTASNDATAQGAAAIRFRSDTDGIIRSVDVGYRGSLIGMTMVEPARAEEAGFDAGVARAFGKRAPIRAGRLLVLQNDGQSVTYQVFADPQFDRMTGRFRGYVGTFTPLASLADINTEVVSGTQDSRASAHTSDSAGHGMAQMVHELRSPLNAINGFAQLIEGQFFGPVATRYRELAMAIMADAQLLVHALEDVDLAARLDIGTITAAGGQCDLAEILARYGITNVDASVPIVINMHADDANRLVARLFDIAQRAEPHDNAHPVDAVVFRDTGVARLEVTLRDAGPGVDAAIATASGGIWSVDFALRVLAELAAVYGAELHQNERQLILNFPQLGYVERRFGGNGHGNA